MIFTLALLTAALASPPDATVWPADGPIVVDGRLSEPAWASAVPITQWRRFQPTAGPGPDESLEVRFLQDQRALYIGVTVTDAAHPIRARLSAREALNADDQVGIYLDPIGDAVTGYIFYLNALGIQQDLRYATGRWNMAWDTAFRSRGHVTDDGFTLEIAIPWRALRYPRGDDPQDWGLIVTRKIPSEGAKYAYPSIDRGHPRLFQQAGTLQGVMPANRGAGPVLVPALTAAQTWPRADGELAGFDGPRQIVRPSLDVSAGVSSQGGVALTVLPDFSQVESDVSDVRLNARFAFNFPERRPFFLDGVEATSDRTEALYTRSINAPAYGARLTLTQGATQLGALHALDLRPIASFHEANTPGFTLADVTGRVAANTVARARLNTSHGGYIGVTATDKRLFGTASNPGIGGAHSALGLDAEIPLGGRWLAGWQMGHAYTGSGDDRPDVGWGVEQAALIRRASGLGTGFSLGGGWRSPGMRKELGYLTQSDIGWVDALVDHTVEPTGVIDTWTPSVRVEGNLEGNGDHQAGLVHGQELVLNGIHRIYAETGWRRYADEGAVADGPMVVVGYNADWSSAITFGPRFGVERTLDYALGLPAQDVLVALDATLRPTTTVRADLTAQALSHTPAGRAIQRTALLRARLAWQLTRLLGVRLISDISDGTERPLRLHNAVLLTLLDVPGTAIFVGVEDTQERLATWRVSQRAVFLKLTARLSP